MVKKSNIFIGLKKTCLGVLDRGERGKANETGLKEEGGIEIKNLLSTIYAPFAICIYLPSLFPSCVLLLATSISNDNIERLEDPYEILLLVSDVSSNSSSSSNSNSSSSKLVVATIGLFVGPRI